jgi:hypothetical protein
MSEQSEERSELYYFCDESSFLGEEYMAVAGITISRTMLGTVINELVAINEDKKSRGEIKWHNTRKRGVEVRKAYIDYLMKQIAANILHFHIRFSPMNEYDHDGNRREFDTVSKMFYQLLLHRPIRHYGKTCTLRIRPDNGECTRLLPDYIDSLHTFGNVKYGAATNCIHGIVPLDSNTQPMLQLLDVMTGALTAFRNGRHLLDEVGPAKKDLAQYAFDAFGKKDLKNNRDEGSKLSVWNAVPNRPKKVTPES